MVLPGDSGSYEVPGSFSNKIESSKPRKKVYALMRKCVLITKVRLTTRIYGIGSAVLSLVQYYDGTIKNIAIGLI